MRTNKIFTLRVDLESDKGIKEGVPALLDLLKKYNLKASFYLVMGGESNIFEILRYNRKLESSAERSIKIWKLREKLRVVLFPKDFVKANKNILQRILDEGHELGIHGWKHRAWARGLEKINIRRTVQKSIERYEKEFGVKPISWASPGFSTNEETLKILEEYDIKYVSDFLGEETRSYGKIKNVPITLCGENKTPIIEYLVSTGKNDGEILAYLKREAANEKIVSLYIHDLYEARFKINLLEEIFQFVKNQKIENKRIIDY